MIATASYFAEILNVTSILSHLIRNTAPRNVIRALNVGIIIIFIGTELDLMSLNEIITLVKFVKNNVVMYTEESLLESNKLECDHIIPLFIISAIRIQI